MMIGRNLLSGVNDIMSFDDSLKQSGCDLMEFGYGLLQYGGGLEHIGDDLLHYVHKIMSKKAEKREFGQGRTFFDKLSLQ
jgi:hypothetical protein